jgi:dienelactone hydrolase
VAGVARPEIEVAPGRALLDEPTSIRATGFAPGQIVILRAAIVDQSDQRWQSEAVFVADLSGAVNLAEQAPISGAYGGVDSSGLLWSMRPASTEANEERPFPIRGLEPLTITLTVEVAGTTVAAKGMERLVIGDSVIATDVRERGIVGRLFRPPGNGTYPGVVMISGSGGGLPAIPAAFIASHGFVTLALAYFAYEDLPSALKNIPVEYFQMAVSWLREQGQVKADGVGVVGLSRGGELALMLSASEPTIRAVVGLVPSHVVWSGIGAEPDAPSWTHRGKPVPMMVPGENFRPPRPSPEERNGPIELTPLFLASLEDEVAEAQAAIAVERINGSVLVISGKEDAMWPSTLMATKVIDRLKAHNHPFRYEHIAYENAGHTLAGLPNLPAPAAPSVHPITKSLFAYGGTTQGVAKARADAWRRVFQFLRESL